MTDESDPDFDETSDPGEAYEDVQSINSPQTGFFQRIYRSCTDLNFYGLVAVEGKKQAAFYFLKLSLLVGFLTGVAFGLQSWSVVEDVSTELQQQIPRIRVENGSLTMDEETPYRMNLRSDHVLILDPGAELNRIRLEPEVLLVVVDGALHIRDGERSFETWTFSSLGLGESGEPVVIDAQTVENWTSFFQWMVLILAILGLMLGYLIQGGLRVFLISAGGMFARDPESPLFPWGRLIKLSAYAVTPLLLVDGALFILDISLPYQEFLILGGGVFFVYYIVKHLSERLQEVRVELSPDDREGSESDDPDYF